MANDNEHFINARRSNFNMKTELALGIMKKDVDKNTNQENIINEGSSVWIWGESGKGKTLTALRKAWKIYKGEGEHSFDEYGSIIYEKSSWKPMFNCYEIIAYMSYDLCRSFQDASLNNTEYEPEEKTLYVIDDIDKIKMTEFREEQLFRFFDICLKREIKLIVTSQISIQDFASMFSGSFVAAMERRLSQIFKEIQL